MMKYTMLGKRAVKYEGLKILRVDKTDPVTILSS